MTGQTSMFMNVTSGFDVKSKEVSLTCCIQLRGQIQIQNTKCKAQNTKYKMKRTKYKIQNEKDKIQTTIYKIHLHLLIQKITSMLSRV